MSTKFQFKTQLLIIGWLFIASFLQAQPLNVTVALMPPYPIHLEDYVFQNSQVLVVVSNTGGESHQFRLIPFLESNFGLKANVKLSYHPTQPFTIGPFETKTLSYAELKAAGANITENDIAYQGIDKQYLLRTESLPEGDYTLCVKAFDYQSNEQLSRDGGCSFFLLTHYDPPVVINPAPQSNVVPLNPQFVNFSWTPTGMGGITRYRIQLVDMTANGLFNPNDAFLNNIVQPVYTKENIVVNTQPYGPADPPLISGHNYAVRVTAYDPQGKLAFKNQGIGPVSSFTYKPVVINPNINLNDNIVLNNPNNNNQNNQQGNINQQFGINQNGGSIPDPPDGSCQAATKLNPAPSGVNSNGLSNGTEVKVGKFVMKNTQFTQTNGSYSGSGEIKINFLHAIVKVAFTGITINAKKEMTNGQVFAKVTGGGIITDEMSKVKSGVIEQLPKPQELNNMLDQANRRVSKMKGDTPMDLPISFDGDQYNIGIVGIIFEKDEAFLNTVLAMDVPHAIKLSWLTLSAKGVAIHPNGFGVGSVTLALNKDLSVDLSDKVSLQLKSGDKNTFALMDCEGFNSVSVKGAFALSRNVALPLGNDNKVIADDQVKVQVPFALNATTNFENFILDGLQCSHPFAIPEARDFVVKCGGVTFDFSSGAGNNDFKKAFPGKGNDWIGVYIKDASLTLPEGFKKSGGGQITLGIHNFMFDKMGVSGQFLAGGKPLAPGSIAGWGLELDSITVKIQNSSLAGGGLGGNIALPVGDKAKFGFWAAVSKGGQDGANYGFSLETQETIEANLFLANIKLYQGSKVTVKKTDGKFEATALLNGEIGIGISGKKPNCSVSKFSLPNIKFQELSITGRDAANYVPQFDMKFVSLNNQGNIQAKIGDAFELKLKELQFKKNGNSEVGLSIGLGISLFGGENNNSNGAGGGTVFTIWAKHDGKFFKYDHAQLDAIEIKADLGAAYLEGSIQIFDQDNEYGNGFRGAVKAEVTGVNCALDVKLQFGRTLPDKGNFKYWYFDAMVTLPDPGLPIPGTVAALYGFGGGAWCNMSATGGSDVLAPDQYEPQEKGGGAPTESGVTFHPKLDAAGFKAAIMFGIAGKKEAFNGDLTLTMTFNSKTLSVNTIQFVGNGYVMQNPAKKPRDPESAFVQCHAEMLIDIPNRTFDGLFGLKVNIVNIVEGSGKVAFHFKLPQKDGNGKVVDQQGLKWFIKLGWWTKGKDPFDDPNRINAKIGFDGPIVEFNVKFEGYMMVGNDLPDGLPPLPSYIYDLCKSLGADKNKPLPASAVSNNQNLAFALGAGIQINVGFDFVIVSADLQAEAAFDVLISDLNAKCQGDEIGFHGWYAQGQAYAYVHGVGEIFGIEVAEMTAGAVFEIKTPNPTWIRGTVVAYLEVLGFDAGNYEGHFERGHQCYNMDTDVDPFAGAKLIKSVTPVDKSVLVNPIKPKVEVNFTYKNLEDIGVYNVYTEQNDHFLFKGSAKLTTDKGTLIADGYWNGNKVVIPIGKALESQAKYLIVAEGIIYNKQNKVEYSEKKTFSFTTGDRPGDFDMDDLVSSYPLPMQHNFMKVSYMGGQAKGHMKLKNDLFYLFNKPKTTVYARFLELATNKAYEMKCAYSAGYLTYGIPQQLRHEMVYELKIITRTQVEGDGNIDDYSAGDNVYKVIFDGLYFRTSKYDNMNQKLASMKVAKVAYMGYNSSYHLQYNQNDYENSNAYHLPILMMECDEPMDMYESYTFDANLGVDVAKMGQLIRTDNYGSGWLAQQATKFAEFNTLKAADRNYLLGLGVSNTINRPAGFPFEGVASTPFNDDFGVTFYWMKNIDYYQQFLHGNGSLTANENIVKPRNLSTDEINQAKAQANVDLNQFQINPNQGNGGGGMGIDLNLNSNGKAYYALMNFEPMIAHSDKATMDVRMLKKTLDNGKFVYTYNLLKGLGWPQFPAGAHDMRLYPFEPFLGGNDNDYKSWKIVQYQTDKP